MSYTDKERQRAYQRDWYANRRAEYFSDKVCIICKASDGLELDHINSEEKVNHRIWSWSEIRRLEELSKCQVLCKTCHQDKTQSEFGKWNQHGTRGMFRRGKCRCTECKAWKADEVRRTRNNKGF